MSIQIITDSASDISVEEAKQWGVILLPLTVTFGENSYKDGIDLDHSGFFSKLIETDELPTTSQIPPYDYEQAFRNAIDHGDQVLCIALSSKLSGCYQSACIASDDYNDNQVRIVDSENACIGERILVELAIRLRNEGKDLATITNILEHEKKQIRLIALLDTLEYLKKGGRISSTVAIAGSILNIKPVIAVESGAVTLCGTARGSKNGNNKLKELIHKEGGINFDKPYCLAYSGLSTALLDKYISDSKDIYEEHTSQIPIRSIGAVIGTHVGPGAIAAAFFV